jgi:TP901 family phage tail tape measure protein
MAVSLTAIVSLDKTGFASGLSGMSQLVSNVTGAMSMAFGGVASEILMMSKAFGPIGGAVAVLKNVSTAGMEIGQSLAEVASLTNEGAAAIGKFGQLADTVTQSTKFGMTDVVQAMNMFAAAGYESADVMRSVLKPGLDLAAAGGTSTANAVSVMVSALKTFGLEASQATNVANLFAGGANVSMASVESLGEGMVYAGSVASAYGMKLNETIGVLSLYADKGMQGSVAGTAFAQSMAALTKAANEGKTAIGEALKGWNPATEGMQGAIKRLETSGISATAVLAEFGRQGGKAVASLLNSGSEAIANYTAKVGEVGDAADVAAQRQNTLKGSLADLKGEFQRLQFALYAVVKDGLTGFIQSTTEAVQKVVEFAKTIVAGDWEAAGAQIRDLWASVKAGAMAFNWVGLFEDFRDLLQTCIQRVVEFGAKIMEQLGLTRTLDALKAAFETVRNAVNLLFGAAGHLYGQMRDVRWADVARAAVKALDLALSMVVKTIDDALRAVVGLVNGWKSLSSETQTVLLAIVGTAGLVVGLVKLISMVEAAAKATVSFAGAMKLSLISHAETAYLKLLFLVDAIKAVTLAQVGMVAGAAALGVGLGLLIRQIPGVADALDKAAIAMGKFLGLVETEDQQLKRRAAELKRQRQEQLAAMAAQEAATEALRKAAVVTADMTDAENERLVAMQEAQNAADAQVNAIEAMQDAVDDYVPAAADMTDAENERVVAMQLAQDATDAAANKAESAAIAQNKLADGTRNVKSEMVGLLPAIDNFKKSGIGAFDLSKFTLALKQLEMGLKGIAFADIELPDFSTLALPKITQYDVSQFLMGIKRLELGLRGVDLGVIGKLFGLDKVAPGLGGGKTGTRTLDDIYNLLAGARGVIWA